MAFEATHVRFALDLADALRIQNVQTYLSGCVYPDSRYITRISRELTHGPLPSVDGATDFEKGMLTHHWYDELVGPKYMEHSSWPGPVKGMGEAWMYMTAAKLVEDQQSFDELGEKTCFLKEISAPATVPRGERSSDLERYYQVLRDLYRRRPALDAYAKSFEASYLPTEIIQLAKERACDFLADAEAVENVRTYYQQAVQAVLEKIVSEHSKPKTCSC